MSVRKIKTLVVEDEVLLLNHISEKISRTHAGFEIIGKVYNGKDALDLMKKQKPDVVFTDIRMPIMDGLQLVREIREHDPSIAVVIVSGYSDFEYARTALQYGVCDYLLKPVRAEELKEVLDKLEHQFLSERKKEECSLLRQQLRYGNAAEEMETFGVNLKQKRFGVFLVCFGNLLIRSKKIENSREAVDWSKILTDLPESQGMPFVFDETGNQYLVLLEGQTEKWTKTEECLRARLKAVCKDTAVNIAYTEKPVSWEELHRGWQCVSAKLFENFMIGESQGFSSELPGKQGKPVVLSSVTVNHLQTLLNSGNTEGIRNAVLKLFHEWEQAHLPQQCMEKLLHQILLLFQQILFFSEQDYDNMFQNVFTYLESCPDMQWGAEKIAGELAVWGKQKQAVPTEINEAIEQMDSYIRQHYTESIILSELSEKYHFNHSYMTRLFKKIKGQTPMKLIHELRMEDARKMLKNESLSVREISEILGFSDQHYFSRIFKETTGMTPKEFRQGEIQ